MHLRQKLPLYSYSQALTSRFIKALGVNLIDPIQYRSLAQTIGGERTMDGTTMRSFISRSPPLDQALRGNGLDTVLPKLSKLAKLGYSSWGTPYYLPLQRACTNKSCYPNGPRSLRPPFPRHKQPACGRVELLRGEAASLLAVRCSADCTSRRALLRTSAVITYVYLAPQAPKVGNVDRYMLAHRLLC